MESLQGAGPGWLILGVFVGWAGNWLFDRLYRRDGSSASVAAGRLVGLKLEALSADLERLGQGLAERDARLERLQGELLAQTRPASAPSGPEPKPRHARGRRGEASRS